MADWVTVSNLVTEVRRRADMENSQFVTDAEIRSYLNASYREFYDMLVSKYENDYFLSESSISIVANTTIYSLPSDFYKARGVDLLINTSQRVPLSRYNFSNRNRAYSNYNFPYELEYRIQGNNIIFTPTPSGSHTAYIWYTPSPMKLQSVTATGATKANPAVYTVPSPHYFKAGERISLSGFSPTAFNVEQTIASVTATTITTDLDASGFGAGSTFGTIESVFDSVSGWDELLIVDGAIKCLQKEESDVSVLFARKQEILNRISEMAEGRDSGEALTVKDVAVYEYPYVY